MHTRLYTHTHMLRPGRGTKGGGGCKGVGGGGGACASAFPYFASRARPDSSPPVSSRRPGERQMRQPGPSRPDPGASRGVESAPPSRRPRRGGVGSAPSGADTPLEPRTCIHSESANRLGWAGHEAGRGESTAGHVPSPPPEQVTSPGRPKPRARAEPESIPPGPAQRAGPGPANRVGQGCRDEGRGRAEKNGR